MKWLTWASTVVLLTLLVSGCTEVNGVLPSVLARCSHPAPVSGTPTPPSLGYIVLLRQGIDAAAVAPRLASSCGFVLDQRSVSHDHFLAVLDDVALRCVRCDADVEVISANAVEWPTGP